MQQDCPEYHPTYVCGNGKESEYEKGGSAIGDAGMGCMAMYLLLLTAFCYHRHISNSKNFPSVAVQLTNTFNFASVLSENRKELTQVLSSS